MFTNYQYLRLINTEGALNGPCKTYEGRRCALNRDLGSVLNCTTREWERDGLGRLGGLTCFMCHFPFAQVFKPSARSAGFFEFCAVL